jgi:hypothetical protein
MWSQNGWRSLPMPWWCETATTRFQHTGWAPGLGTHWQPLAIGARLTCAARPHHLRLQGEVDLLEGHLSCAVAAWATRHSCRGAWARVTLGRS